MLRRLFKHTYSCSDLILTDFSSITDIRLPSRSLERTKADQINIQYIIHILFNKTYTMYKITADDRYLMSGIRNSPQFRIRLYIKICRN